MKRSREFVECVRDLAEEKHLSAGEIAIMLHVTRNTIIGLVHRAGIKLAKSGAVGGPRQEYKSRKAQPVPRLPRGSFPMIVPDAPLPEPDIVPDNAIGIMELTQGKCRWPYVGTTTRYCGGESIEGLPYCPGHARLAYVPIDSRKLHSARRISTLSKTGFPQVRRAGLPLA